MKYQAKWLIPHKLIYVQLEGQIEGSDMQTTLEHVYSLVTLALPQDIHLLLDLSEMTEESDIADIARAVRRAHLPINLSWLVVAGRISPMLTMEFSLAIQLMDKRMRHFPTRQESIHFFKDLLLSVEWDEQALAELS